MNTKLAFILVAMSAITACQGPIDYATCTHFFVENQTNYPLDVTLNNVNKLIAKGDKNEFSSECHSDITKPSDAITSLTITTELRGIPKTVYDGIKDSDWTLTLPNNFQPHSTLIVTDAMLKL